MVAMIWIGVSIYCLGYLLTLVHMIWTGHDTSRMVSRPWTQDDYLFRPLGWFALPIRWVLVNVFQAQL